MSEQNEFEGKTVDDAIAKGLIELGLSREQADVEILRKGSRGLFGIGSETALVRIVRAQSTQSSTSVDQTSTTESPTASSAQSTSVTSAGVSQAAGSASAGSSGSDSGASSDTQGATSSRSEGSSRSQQDDDPTSDYSDQDIADMSIEYMEELLDLMDFDGDVTAEWREPEPDETEPCLYVTVDGNDLGSLIGRRGETLSSLQYLLRLMINQKVRTWRNIVVDVAGYKEKRQKQLNQLANQMADQVVESGRAISLEPMPANERRLVHLSLRDRPDVYTESSGDSDRRKVHILPQSLLE